MLGFLHRVGVFGDALGVGIKGKYLHRNLNEIDVVQPPSMFADMANYLDVQDSGVDFHA